MKKINGKIDIKEKETDSSALDFKKNNTINKAGSPEFNNDNPPI